MAKITLGGKPTETVGALPKTHSKAPSFTLSAHDLSPRSLSDYGGQRKILNIFPSVDTAVCAASVRKFNETGAAMANTKVLCISRDLPFAQARFCAAEGITGVEMLSDHKTGAFGKKYGVEITHGAFAALLARAVVVLDGDNTVVHAQLVAEIGQEPDYGAALNTLA
ncbi:MAG: thiol peroxidase [Marinirhabdus sp.]